MGWGRLHRNADRVIALLEDLITRLERTRHKAGLDRVEGVLATRVVRLEKGVALRRARKEPHLAQPQQLNP